MKRLLTPCAVLLFALVVVWLSRQNPWPDRRVPTVDMFSDLGEAGAEPSTARLDVRPEPLPLLKTTGPGWTHRGDVNASGSTGSLAEVSIAVDRFNPDRVVAAAMNTGAGRNIRAMASQDAGATWMTTDLPLSQDSRFDADPMVAWDSNGTVHIAKIAVIPGNPNPVSVGIEMTRSIDGGRTWSKSLEISDDPNDDKIALTVDDEPDSPYRDHVYVAWKHPERNVFFSSSEDRGLTFSPVRQISGASISGLDLATDADGAVYLVAVGHASFSSSKSILLFRSLNGGASFEPTRSIARVRADGYTNTPAVCRRMSIVHASIAVDRSQGADRGDLYVAWNDYQPGSPSSCGDSCDPSTACTSDVYFIRSRDRGDTWSQPAPVHETDLGTSDQFHHWIAADPESGEIYVSYKDTRDDPQRRQTHVYLNRLEQGSGAFRPSIRVSSAPSFATTGFQYGDYRSLAVAGSRTFSAWADFRSGGGSQIWVGRVDFGTGGLSHRPEQAEFGSVEVGRSRRRKIVVNNDGTETVELRRLLIRGSDRGNFKLIAAGDRCSGTTLPPSGACRFRVRFRPDSAGLKEAEVRLRTKANRHERIEIALRGTGAP